MLLSILHLLHALPIFSPADCFLISHSVILLGWLEQNNKMKLIKLEAQQNHSLKINSVHIPTSSDVLSPNELERMRS